MRGTENWGCVTDAGRIVFAYMDIAARLYDECCKHINRAISDGKFSEEGPVFRGSQSWKGRRSLTGAPGTHELAIQLAKHLMTCSADDVDAIAKKYVPCSVNGMRAGCLDVAATFNSHLANNGGRAAVRPPNASWQWYPWLIQAWAAAAPIRPWPVTDSAASPGHRLLAAALGVGAWSEVWCSMWNALCEDMFGSGGIIRMMAAMLFLFRINQASPWNHNWDYGGYGGEDAALDIRDVFNGYIHYVLKGPPPVDPRAGLSTLFRRYAISVISRHRARATGGRSSQGAKRARRA